MGSASLGQTPTATPMRKPPQCRFRPLLVLTLPSLPNFLRHSYCLTFCAVTINPAAHLATVDQRETSINS